MKKILKRIVLIALILLVAIFLFLNYFAKGIIFKNPVSQTSSTSDLPSPTNAPSTGRFIFLADTRGDNNGINEPVLKNIFSKIQELSPKPEYICCGGDLVTGSHDTAKFESQLVTFKNLYSKYFPMETLLPVFGNHEQNSATNDNAHEVIFSNIFSDYKAEDPLDGFNRTTYYIDYGNVRLIVLNSYQQGETGQITGSQLSWFKKVSAKEINKIKFVFVHTPAYPTGAHIESSLDEYSNKRDKFWKVIDENDVMVMFCGHEHNYSRRVVDSSINPLFTRPVYQVVAGAAGMLNKNTDYPSKAGVIVPPIAEYHFVIVDVGVNETNIKAVNLNGKTIDEFTIPNIY